MPELVTVERDERAGMRRESALVDGAPLRIVLEELADEPARRALDETDQDRVAAALVVRRVEVKADVIARLRVEVQRARVGITVGARLERLARDVGQKADERGRAIKGQDGRRLLHECVVADAAALLVTRDVVAMHGRADTFDLGDHALDDRGRHPALEIEELVLLPVGPLDGGDVETGERALDLVGDRCHRSLAHEPSFRSCTSEILHDAVLH